MLTRKIWITFSVVGYHRYPDAPDEVAYLRNEHRHVFQYKVTLDVAHNEREVEFHMLGNYCKALFEDQLQANNKSCETLAQDLLNRLRQKYGKINNEVNTTSRAISVEVSEDGECGAIVSFEHVGM